MELVENGVPEMSRSIMEQPLVFGLDIGTRNVVSEV